MKINNINDLDINKLKQNYKMIHYFGLGFIQLKINKSERLHFYTKLLPRITDIEEVHNHRYDFESTILYGNLKQEIFNLIDGDEYIIENESCNPDNKIISEKKYCGIKKAEEHNFVKGSKYFIDHDTYHNVHSTDAITFLKRSDYKKDYAKVIRKNGKASTCPFSVKIDEDELWDLAGQIIAEAKSKTT